MSTSSLKKTICIDFDGVIHSFTTPWKSPTEIPDPPVPGAFDAIKEYLAAGYQVVIFTSRMHPVDQDTQMPRPSADKAIRDWFEFHGALELFHCVGLTFEKVPAVLYIDDRGYHFTGSFPSVEFIQNFRPWNKPLAKL